jgi:elongation factor P
MDTETFEQTAILSEVVGGAADFLMENQTAFVLVTEGKSLGVELPNFVELTVTHTDPGVRGDTAQGSSKPATVETGATVSVPLFVERGDKLKIDTRTGSYVERV